METVLCFAWKRDNAGPAEPSEVHHVFDFLSSEFPGAHIEASTFDAYLEELLAKLPQLKLEVVTQEIGDTWSHGVQSDPLKTQHFLAISRARTACLLSGECVADNPVFANFSRLLLKIPEHTWSVDIKKGLKDWTIWNNTALREAISRENFQQTIFSWLRQRKYLEWAVEALGGASPAKAIETELKALEPRRSDPPVSDKSWTPVTKLSELAEWGQVGGFELGIDPMTGALSTLAFQGVNWASKEKPFGLFQYDTYAENDFDFIWTNYAYRLPLYDWFYKDFGKPNCSVGEAGAKHTTNFPTVTRAWRRSAQAGEAAPTTAVLVYAEMPQHAHEFFGSPAGVWLEWSVAGEASLSLAVTLNKKTASRLPEAAWVRFAGPGRDDAQWRVEKLNSLIDPMDVLLNGSMSMHAVDSVRVAVAPAQEQNKQTTELRVTSLDAALACMGEPFPFPNPTKRPNIPRDGFSFNLLNSIWGTNYPQWYPFLHPSTLDDDTIQYRFHLDFR